MRAGLHITLLGNAEIRRDGAVVTGFRSSKAQALLSYLAVTGRPHTRPALAGLLWGDMPEASARRNLTKTLSNLRQLVGPHLDITHQTVGFDRDSAYWLDVEVFESLVSSASTDAEVEPLREAVELYRGDFLEGFYVRNAPEFEDWALAQRARLRELALQALHTLSHHYTQQRDAGRSMALDYTTRLLALEPWREEAHRSLMLLLARSGQRGAALAQYEVCRKVLAEELGVEPGAETVTLARAIQEDRIQLDVPEAVTSVPREIRLVTKPTPRPHFPTSLVGRAAEMETLRRVWEQVVQGKGQVVLVDGEPGIGKTRLIEELLAEVAENVIVLRAKCPDLQDPLTYTLFVDPLRQALSGDRPPGLTDTWLAEVSRLLPELHDRYPDLSRPAQLDPASERRRLFDAVCTTLLALANGQPLVLFTDDLQWSDVTSLELLNYLSGWVSEAPVLIVGACRPNQMGSDHPLQRPRQDWQRTGLLTSLSLDTLSETAVAQLLQELTTWTGREPSFGKLIYRETGGHPLFVVETVASLRDEGRLPESAEDWSGDLSAETMVIPSQVQTVIETRLHGLDGPSLGLITAASVLRSSFEAEMVQAVGGRSELETLESLERLLGVGLLIQAGRDRFDFSHDKIREVAYGSLSQLRRKRLHRRVAKILERRHRGREKTVAERLAYHYDEAGLPDKALEYHLQAAHSAREQYAHEAAIGHYQNALAYLKKEKDYERAARTLMQLGLTHHNAFNFQRAHRAYEEGFVLWRQAAEVEPEVPLPPAPHALRLDFGDGDPPTLDPGMSYSPDSFEVITNLFSGLVGLSPELDVLPDVARSWELSEGGRGYLFHLRDDIHWSDGTPLTAEDFEYAWKRVLDPAVSSPNAGLLYDVKGARAFHRGEVGRGDVGVRAFDEATLSIELEGPTGYFLQLLAHPACFPVPRHVVEARGEAWTKMENMVTNGPFRLEAWRRGKSMIMVRNHDYYGCFRGNVHRVELSVPRQDPSATLDRYEADGLDVLHFLTSVDIDRVRQQHVGEYVSVPMLSTFYLGFDVSKPPFDDRRVRRAFALATDSEVVADVVLRGHLAPATGGFVPPGMPGHSPWIGLPCDPERARELLAEAGYPKGRGFPIVDLLLPPGWPVAEQLQALWQESLGVKIRWKIMEWAMFFDKLGKEPPPLFCLGWKADYPDPDNFLRASEIWRSTRWRNEAYEELVEEARRLTDQPARMKLYRQADRILVEEAAIVPLGYDRHHILMKPWVSKYPISAAYGWFFKDVVIEPH